MCPSAGPGPAPMCPSVCPSAGPGPAPIGPTAGTGPVASPLVVLCAIGDLVEDVVVYMGAAPRRGDDAAARIVRRRGGSAANVAASAARAGFPARFVGQVGDDVVGSRLVRDLRVDGVDTCVVTGGRSGAVVALVEPGGERTMFSDRGAAPLLSAVPDTWLDGVGMIHVPAYSLLAEPLATAVYDVFGTAAELGIDVSLDASAVSVIDEFGVREFRRLVRELRPAVLLCNRSEAAHLGLRARSPAPGVRLTVVKAGPRPTLVIHPDGSVDSVPVPPIADVRDTTGAGDAFAAGFLSALIQGRAPRDAAVVAHRVAAEAIVRSSVQARGAHP